ncbi:Predicted phospholipase, patatin/cPLA2 family [Marinobacter daqiaonensis]|uniref:Predicted phospholipase, patatin/cPLA2 family n=1 Tax=Marinobacter daqiaonensis TaxID=650891 RepID=A0A1I6HI96_9GAMM|nr:patatin family protein [Marinobacter daqiaonensis]SFR54195.1 Predicted phospholipase, patatin/cPLA2 family [Marinobacter daqiaonensis]
MPEKNSTNTNPALVVEGGAMRGIFAAGVLDAFLEAHFQPFSSAWGVSAGSTTLIGYLCGDYGRNRQVITDHACRPEFINWKRFLGGGHLCDVHWLWHQSWRDVPLGLDRYMEGNTRLWVATTSAESGEPRYFMVDDHNLHDVFTASCSIPLAYRDYPMVGEEAMSDGGIADSIPVQEAYRRGARDITVVLSRPARYRKAPVTFTPLIRTLFRDRPALAQAVMARGEQYNQALSFIDNPPADCSVRVIAPPHDFPVSRLTTDPDKLELGYRQGLRAGQHYLEF